MRAFNFYLLVAIAISLNQFVFGAILGVDYGYQNIKAMIVSPKAPLEMVLTPESKRKDLSGLAFKALGSGKNSVERMFGSSIGSLATRFPQNTLLNLKELLGVSSSDEDTIDGYTETHPGVLVKPSKWNSVSFSVINNEYPVEELVAMNIQEIVRRANELLDSNDELNVDKVSGLAITIPEYAGFAQRDALLKVGEMTTDQLPTYLVHDGLSVAVNFAMKNRDLPVGEKCNFIIYDMGASATQATLFSILTPQNASDPIEVDIGGYGFDDELGGSYFNTELYNLIKEKFIDSHPEVNANDLNKNVKALAKIMQSTEKAKLVLSANLETSVNIESIIDEIDFRAKITRSEFEASIAEMTSRAINPIQDAVASQYWEDKIEMDDIKGIILVGGSQRVPAIQKSLESFVGDDKLLRNVNADESSVNGVTIRGVRLSNAFRTKSMKIIERSSNTYSVANSNSKNPAQVFSRGDVFPSTESFIIETLSELPKTLELQLFENEDNFMNVSYKLDDVSKNKRLSSCEEGFAFNATFDLSQDRIFGVKNLNIICLNSSLTYNETKKEAESIEMERASLFEVNVDNYVVPVKSQLENYDMQLLNYRNIQALRKHIISLNQADRARFELHEIKNVFEGLLYDTANFLESVDESKLEIFSEYTQLKSIVPEFLEWIDNVDDSVDSKLVLEKATKVESLKEKLEFFVLTLDETLDEDEFASMNEKSEELLNIIEEYDNTMEEFMKNLKVEYEGSDIDVENLFNSIRLPTTLSQALTSYNNTLADFKDIKYMIQYYLDGGVISTIATETLFELKLSFEETYLELEELIKSLVLAHDYRIREMKSVIQRKLKSNQRKAERQKLKEKRMKSKAESNSTIIEDNDVTNNTSTKLTKRRTSKKNVKTSASATTSVNSGEESKDEKAQIHDEL